MPSPEPDFNSDELDLVITMVLSQTAAGIMARAGDHSRHLE